MKKKFLALSLALLAVFSIFGCSKDNDNKPTETESTVSETAEAIETTVSGETEPETENLSTPYFWKVEGNGYDGEFYLLGSIHVGDKHTNLYPEEITKAFDSCDYLAVESDIVEIEKDMALQIKMLQTLVYLDGTKITDHIDTETYEAAREILKENNMYNQLFDMYMPVYWSTLIDNIYLSQTDYLSDYGVDRYFLKKAKDENKDVLEIEDAVETYKAMGELSESTQEYMLKVAVDPEYLTESLEGVDELYSVWKTGDVTGHEDLFSDEIPEGTSAEEIAAYEEYNNMLLTTRNADMVKTAVSYMESDMDIFYVVGLAHMFGDDGLVESLTDLGYTVTQIQYR